MADAKVVHLACSLMLFRLLLARQGWKARSLVLCGGDGGVGTGGRSVDKIE